jgi:hypothetical protein
MVVNIQGAGTHDDIIPNADPVEHVPLKGEHPIRHERQTLA